MRHRGRSPGYVIVTKVSFSFPRRPHRLQPPRFLVKKQISMIMADLSWGHINIFRGDTRGLCFSWHTRGLYSQGMQRTNK